jgi:hypothetical protein
MDHQEDQDDDGRMDHELREKRGDGVVGLVVTMGPRNPVLDLKDQGIDNMQQEPAKQNDLKDLNQNVSAHKVSCLVVDHGVFEDDDQEVDPHMNQHEYNEENSGQGHPKFLSN